ncbi:MAG: zf-HC2 domain-containing protein [Acidimicrobiia bacterium]
MTEAMTHRDIQEFLGAYALDAVEEEERRTVERHLTICPECRSEVVDHREVAARLAPATAGPPGLWTAFRQQLAASRILLEEDDRE